MIEPFCHLWPMTILYFAGASSQFYLADTKRNHSELPNTPCAQIHSLVFIFQQFYHSSFVLQPFWSFSVFPNIVGICSLVFESHITVVLNHFHKWALSCEIKSSVGSCALWRWTCNQTCWNHPWKFWKYVSYMSYVSYVSYMSYMSYMSNMSYMQKDLSLKSDTISKTMPHL